MQHCCDDTAGHLIGINSQLIAQVVGDLERSVLAMIPFRQQQQAQAVGLQSTAPAPAVCGHQAIRYVCVL